MKNQKNSKGRWAQLLPVLLCLVLMVLALIYRDQISLEAIVTGSPENPVLAAAVLLLLYALKSLSIFFPLLILQIAGGHLFSLPVGLAVNLTGMFLDLAIPYLVGRISGAGFTGWLIRRFPKLEELVDMQQENDLFLSFFLRIISCLPSDAVGMYLGATGTPFSAYIIGGMLGVLPGTICSTCMGESLLDPTSPMFLLSAGIVVSLSLLSFTGYHFYRKRRK